MTLCLRYSLFFAIEPLLQEIEKTPQVRSSFQQKISAYADDVVCFTKASSTETLFDIIECFCSATQLEINKSKTAVISRKNRVKGFASQKQLKNLGFTHHIGPRTEHLCMKEIQQKVRNVCSRKMSMRGKAINLDIFVNSKILSRSGIRNVC